MRRTLSRLSNGKSLAPADLVAIRRDISSFNDDLRLRISRIQDPDSSEVSSDSPTDTYEDNAVLIRWAKLLLSALIDQSFCMFYHPLVRVQAQQIWPDLHVRSIERCQSFLIKCAQMVSSEEFGLFHWSWPGNHQPLHATMILLIDLIQTPNSPSAAASIQVIDIVFALSGPSGGLVAGPSSVADLTDRSLNEGGREAWSYLRRLRVRAWLKSGLDPNVIWTRKAAIECSLNQQRLDMQFPQDDHPIRNVEAPNEETSGIADQMSWQNTDDQLANIDWNLLDSMFGGNFEPMDFGQEGSVGDLWSSWGTDIQ